MAWNCRNLIPRSFPFSVFTYGRWLQIFFWPILVDLGIISPKMNIEKSRDFSVSTKYIDISPINWVILFLGRSWCAFSISWQIQNWYMLTPCYELFNNIVVVVPIFFPIHPVLREFILLNPQRDCAVLHSPLLSICFSHQRDWGLSTHYCTPVLPTWDTIGFTLVLYLDKKVGAADCRFWALCSYHSDHISYSNINIFNYLFLFVP